MLEDLRVRVGREVAEIPPCPGVGRHHSGNQLPQGPFAFRAAGCAVEVTACHHHRRGRRPGRGKLDTALAEIRRAVPPVGEDDVAPVPADLVEGVQSRLRVRAAYPQTGLRGRLGRLSVELGMCVEHRAPCGLTRTAAFAASSGSCRGRRSRSGPGEAGGLGDAGRRGDGHIRGGGPSRGRGVNVICNTPCTVRFLARRHTSRR
jgi:hypothetical protein